MSPERKSTSIWTVLEERVPQVFDEIDQARRKYGETFDPKPLALVHLLNRVSNMISRLSSEELEPLGLTVGEFGAVMVLQRADEPMTMGELARRVSVSPPNLSGVVRRLEQLGFVDRLRHPVDRRSTLLALTSDGRARVESSLTGHWSFLSGLFEPLSDEQRATLMLLVTEVLAKHGEAND